MSSAHPSLVARSRSVRTSSIAGAASTDCKKFVLLAALHAAIGIVAMRYPAAATVHAWGTLLVGLVWVFSSRKLLDLACLGGYIIGAEVLWRMTDASAFWEMGKYNIIAIFGLACFVSHGGSKKSAVGWFFALLVPSCLITFSESGFSLARQQVSFNLSGPLAIVASAAFFSRLQLDKARIAAIFRAAILPIISISAVVAYSMATSTKLHFGSEANLETSGGFGPNQVSIVFALGALLAMLIAMLLEPKANKTARLMFFALAVGFIAQSMLTFSRSGLYTFAAALLVAMIFTARNRQMRRVYFGATVVAYIVIVYVVFPRLDDFTSGAIGKRFAETSVTGRDKLIMSDLEVWSQSPLFGVGPGLAQNHRAIYFRAVPAHCEVTRMLAEHGALGLLAMIVLAYQIFVRIRTFKDTALRAAILACVSFALLFMVTNAMRIVAPSFLIGLAFAQSDARQRRPDRR